ncbi:MAG: SagB/ThcOx family dehydrogenase [Acidobacteriota bacterium]
MSALLAPPFPFGWLALAVALAWLAGPALTAPAPPSTATIALPAPQKSGPMSLEQALAQRRSVREFAPAPLALAEVGQLLWAAQGTNRPDGRRTAPSAGATYPLELWLLAGKVDGLPPGLYRYEPGPHRLLAIDSRDRRAALAAAAHGQEWLAAAPAVVVVAAVPTRTAARYGERTERYVAIEVGHAAENLCLQAVALGLGTVPVGAFSDREVERLLGMPAGEVARLLLPVGRPR